MVYRFPTFHPAFRLAVPLALTFLLVPAAAVADEDALATARAEFAAGELIAAQLRLKALLQEDPDNGQGRFLLARTYLDLRDGGAAEQELNRARSAGVSGAQVAPLMAEALLLQRQFARALDATEIGAANDPALRARLLALRAEALSAMDDPAAADAALDQALRLDPASVPALVAKAKLVLSTRGAEDALAVVGQALAVDPDAPDALELRGDLAVVEGRYQDAVADFTAAQQQATDKWMLLYKRALARIETGDLTGAAADIARAQEAFPAFAALLYARGRLAFAQENWVVALELMEQFLNATTSAPPIASYYAGAAAYKQGYFEQAKEYLSGFLAQAPNSLQAAVLLSTASMRLGDYDDAERVIRPFAQLDKPPVEALRVFGAVLERQGHTAEAGKIAQRLAKLAPADRTLRLNLVQSELAQSDFRAAKRELDRLYEEAPDDPDIRVALVRYHIAVGDGDAAVAAAEAFTKDRPDSAKAYQALGAARLAAGDVKGAKASLEKALDLSPGLSSVANKLAQIALAEGRDKEARRRYEAVLELDPGNTAAILALVRMDIDAGARASALERLEAALSARPDSVELRLNLANGYLREGRVAEAARLLAETPRDAADDILILAARVKAALMMDQPYNAMASAQRLVELHPDSADAQYLLGRTLAVTGQRQGVNEALLNGFRLDPDHPDAMSSLAAAFDAGDEAQRATLLAGMRHLHPNHPMTKLFQARTLLISGDYGAAIRLLERLYRGAPEDAAFFEALFRAQADGHQVDAAIKTGESWLARHPDDARTRMRMAQLYANAGQPEKAVSEYRAVLASQPNSLATLNNLAGLLTATNPAEAVTFARRAHGVAPDSPAIADTLGMALMAAGNVAEARSLLKQAYDALPANATVKMHYAQALLASGERDDARRLLLTIANKPFEGSQQVAELLKELQ